MNCNECHHKMMFAGRLISTRIFLCAGCKRLVLIADGGKRHDYVHESRLPPGITLAEKVKE